MGRRLSIYLVIPLLALLLLSPLLISGADFLDAYPQKDGKWPAREGGVAMYFIATGNKQSPCSVFLPGYRIQNYVLCSSSDDNSFCKTDDGSDLTAKYLFRSFSDLYTDSKIYKAFLQDGKPESICKLRDLYIAYAIFNRSDDDSKFFGFFKGIDLGEGDKADAPIADKGFEDLMLGEKIEGGDYRRMIFPLKAYCTAEEDGIAIEDMGAKPFLGGDDPDMFCYSDSNEDGQYAPGCEPFQYSGVGGCCSKRGKPDLIIAPRFNLYPTRFHSGNNSVLLFDRSKPKEVYDDEDDLSESTENTNVLMDYKPWDFFKCYSVKSGDSTNVYRWGTVPEICAARGGIILGANVGISEDPCNPYGFPGSICVDSKGTEFQMKCENCNFKFWSEDDYAKRYKVRSTNDLRFIQSWYDPYHSFFNYSDKETKNLNDEVDNFKNLTSPKAFNENLCCGDNPLADKGQFVDSYYVNLSDKKVVQDGTSVFACLPSEYREDISDGSLAILDAGYKDNLYKISNVDFSDTGVVFGGANFDYIAANNGYTKSGKVKDPNWFVCANEYSMTPSDFDLTYENKVNILKYYILPNLKRDYEFLEYNNQETSDQNYKGMWKSGNLLKKYQRLPFVEANQVIMGSIGGESPENLDFEGVNNPAPGGAAQTGGGSGGILDADSLDFGEPRLPVPCDADGDGFFSDQDPTANCDKYHNLPPNQKDCDDSNSMIYPQDPESTTDLCGEADGNNDSDCQCALPGGNCDTGEIEGEDYCIEPPYTPGQGVNLDHVMPYRFMCAGDMKGGFIVECCGHNKEQCVNQQYRKTTDDYLGEFESNKRLRRIGSPLNTLFEFPCQGEGSSASNCAYAVGVSKPAKTSSSKTYYSYLAMSMSDMNIGKEFFNYTKGEKFKFLDIIMKFSTTYAVNLKLADCDNEVPPSYLDDVDTPKDFSDLGCEFLKVNGNEITIPLARYITNGPELNKWLHIRIPIGKLSASGRVDLLVFEQKSSNLIDLSKKVTVPRWSGMYDNVFAIDRIYLSKSPANPQTAKYNEKDYYCTALTRLSGVAPGQEQNPFGGGNYEAFWLSSFDKSDADPSTGATLEYGDQERPLSDVLHSVYEKYTFETLCNSVSGYGWTGTQCCGDESGNALRSAVYGGDSSDLEIYNDTVHGCLFSSRLKNGDRAAVVSYQTCSEGSDLCLPVYTFCYNGSRCHLPVQSMLQNNIFSNIDKVEIFNKDPDNVKMSVINPEGGKTDITSDGQEFAPDQLLSAHAPMSIMYFNKSFYGCKMSEFVSKLFNNNVAYQDKGKCEVASGYFCDSHIDNEGVMIGWSDEESGEEETEFIADPTERDTQKNNSLPGYVLNQPFGRGKNFDNAKMVKNYLEANGWVLSGPTKIEVSDPYSLNPNFYVNISGPPADGSEGGSLSSNEFFLDKDTPYVIEVEYGYESSLFEFKITFESSLGDSSITVKRNDAGSITDGTLILGTNLETFGDSEGQTDGDSLTVVHDSNQNLLMLRRNGFKIKTSAVYKMTIEVVQGDVLIDDIKIYPSDIEQTLQELEGEFGPDLPQIDYQSESCCPNDYCWTGEYCVAAELYERDANREPMFISGDGSFGYRCVIEQGAYEEAYDDTVDTIWGEAEEEQKNDPEFLLGKAKEDLGKQRLNAVWVPSHKKYTWDRQKSGWCSYEDQCLVDPDYPDWKYGYRSFKDNRQQDAYYGLTDSFGMRTLLPQCVNNGQFIGDHICVNGTWLTRTRLIANELLDYYTKSDKIFSSPKEMTLYCANYRDVINDLKYSVPEGGIVENLTEPGSDEITVELGAVQTPKIEGGNGDDQQPETITKDITVSECGFYAEAAYENHPYGMVLDNPQTSTSCINNVCVLNVFYGDDEQETIVGTSLNIDPHDESYGFDNINSLYEVCEISADQTGNYVVCDDNDKAFINNDTMSVIFSSNAITSDNLNENYATILDSIVDFMSNLITAIFGTSLHYEVSTDMRKKFSAVEDFDDIYIMTYEESKPAKKIMAYSHSAFVPDLNYYFKANYTNLENPEIVCKSLRTFDHSAAVDNKGLYDVTSAGDWLFDDFFCAQEGNVVNVEARVSDSEVLDMYRLFDASKKITAMIRMQDV